MEARCLPLALPSLLLLRPSSLLTLPPPPRCSLCLSLPLPPPCWLMLHHLHRHRMQQMSR